MSLNWKEIDLILSELPLENGRIQKVSQVSFHTLLLEIYHPDAGRWTLGIFLAQNRCRLHQVTLPVTGKRSTQQRFMQLLRSRITGGRIIRAAQIDQTRIVEICIDRSGERSVLYIRLWGGASNAVLCSEDGVILDACWRRPGRGEVSGERFSFPEQSSAPKTYEVRPYPRETGFNAYIEQQYRSGEITQLKDQLRSQVETMLGQFEASLVSRLSSMEAQILDDGARTRELADIVAANLHLIQPGDVSMTADDFYHGNVSIEIPLDPKLSPGEQAEAYYRRSKKQQRTREHLIEDIENIKRQLEEISRRREELLTDQKDPEQQVQLLREYISEASSTADQTPDQERIPGLQFRSGHFRILVGRNARENDLLLRNHTRGNDYWLHARDFPGGYVFIKYHPSKTVPLETLLDAASLALYYSKARKNGKGDLYYTQVKYLRRAKHGKTGTVIPTQEKNLYAEIDQKRLKDLLGGTL